MITLFQKTEHSERVFKPPWSRLCAEPAQTMALRPVPAAPTGPVALLSEEGRVHAAALSRGSVADTALLSVTWLHRSSEGWQAGAARRRAAGVCDGR